MFFVFFFPENLELFSCTSFFQVRLEIPIEYSNGDWIGSLMYKSRTLRRG